MSLIWETVSINFLFNNTLCKAMIIPYRCLIKNHYVLLMKWMFLICKTTALFTQGCLWQDLLKIALIWSKRFSNFVKCIFAIPPSPEKGVTHHLNKNWRSGSGEEDGNLKSLKTDVRTDGQTDDERSKKLNWAFSSGDLKNKLTLD